MNDAVDDVLAAVAAEITPDEAERQEMWQATEELLERTRSALKDRDITADVVHVGSTARNTWISGDRDIDIFVRFPPDIDRETLRDHGLSIGRAVLPDGEATYAEHPYITGTYNGFDVDIVPCLDVPDASEAKTAVDRTPFHNAYVDERLDEAGAREVRLAKAFTAGFDAYGSNLRTRGFGGYLLELLILEFGSLQALLEDAADWKPPVEFDPADHGTTSFEDALVMIDPTDPERNVAAVVTAQNVARLQHYARSFLDTPDVSFFESTQRQPFTVADLDAELARRQTSLFGVVIDRPDLVDDQLYPQLRKTKNGLVELVDRAGFNVVRATAGASAERILILIECAHTARPAIEHHVGPPVSLRPHAERFLEAYEDQDVYGPFIEDDRYIVERERHVTEARELLASDAVFDAALGDHLATAMKDGYEVYQDDELAECVETFAAAFAAYFDPRP